MGKNNRPSKQNLSLTKVMPKNTNQRRILDSEKNLVLHGWPGTGKTFLAIYKALKKLEYDERFNKIIIVRSAVSTRNIGFMPGNLNEKVKIYEDPYVDIFSKLYGRDDAYGLLKAKGLVEFFTTSNIRGRNIDNSIVVVDEFSNLNYHELRSVVTRLNENCLIYMCGDKGQTDIRDDGVLQLEKVLKKLPEDFDLVYLEKEDIVRSGLVKRFIIAEQDE